jgi:DNA replication protein
MHHLYSQGIVYYRKLCPGKGGRRVKKRCETLKLEHVVGEKSKQVVVQGDFHVPKPKPGIEKVADLWAEEKVQAEQNKQQHAALAGQFKQRPSPLMKVINLFEREFGRALTPIEIDKINNWYYDNGYADNLINEALKRAVLRGILNMNYIDKILASWAKMNIRTTREIIEYEEKFLNKKKQVRRVNRETVKSQDEKFKDIYLT